MFDAGTNLDQFNAMNQVIEDVHHQSTMGHLMYDDDRPQGSTTPLSAPGRAIGAVVFGIVLLAMWSIVPDDTGLGGASSLFCLAGMIAIGAGVLWFFFGALGSDD